MGIEKQTRTIGEYSYEVTQFGAKLGNRVLMKIMKAIAPLVAVAASSKSLSAIDSNAVAAGLAGVSEDDFEWLVDQFAAATDVQLSERQAPSLKSVFDLHFAGRYGHMLEWLAFAIEVNYGPFFHDMKAKAAERLAAVKGPAPASSSPTT